VAGEYIFGGCQLDQYPLYFCQNKNTVKMIKLLIKYNLFKDRENKHFFITFLFFYILWCTIIASGSSKNVISMNTRSGAVDKCCRKFKFLCFRQKTYFIQLRQLCVLYVYLLFWHLFIFCLCK